MNEKEPKGTLVAVYGTLRRGFGNNRLLQNEFSEFLGQTKTKPIYTMISLGGFPGVLLNGDQSITIEVFRVTDSRVLQNLNRLEGHRSKDDPNNFYNVTDVETEFGNALMYILGDKYETNSRVSSGDWAEYRNVKVNID